MKLYAINLGTFKLDGGAMFGVVPKSIWQRTNPADDNNMCTWALRLLLIDTGDRKILVDTGMGDKQSEKFFGYYYMNGHHSLSQGLAEHGFTTDAITDVFLTHLHFDHVGGAVEKTAEGKLQPTFKNARYWTNKRHWQWATQPNPREKASFLAENLQPLEESGQLNFIDTPQEDGIIDTPLGFKVLLVSGHTEAQMLPLIEHQGKTMVYCADLLPSTGHIPLPYVMGYDVRPLVTLKEKAPFLKEATEKGYYLFLEHDSVNEICTLKNTEKGPRLDETLTLSAIFS
jgi:glyoxylase-like metal-dependent hydrolase (beta-lactamase superfamily II)